MTFFYSTKTYIEIWALLKKVDSLHVDCIAFMNLQHLPFFFTSLLNSKFQILLHHVGLSTSVIMMLLFLERERERGCSLYGWYVRFALLFTGSFFNEAKPLYDQDLTCKTK
jgi:hypothetical protein